jgi:hypothetical protein
MEDVAPKMNHDPRIIAYLSSSKLLLMDFPDANHKERLSAAHAHGNFRNRLLANKSLSLTAYVAFRWNN